MTSFLVLIAATAVILVIAVSFAYFHTRDTFHPTICLGSMLAFMYVYMPAHLAYYEPDMLRWFLAEDKLVYIQSLNLLGILAICGGIVAGSHPAPSIGHARPRFQPLPAFQRRLLRVGLGLGIVGVLAYVYQIVNVGGFSAAYGTAYGGGWSDTGYVRELVFLTIPGLLFIMLAHVGRRPSPWVWGLIAIIAAPFVLQGLLGARRGPTFVVVASLAAGWYLIRHRRPSPWLVLSGGILLAGFLLFLVSNRGEIHLGSQFDFDRPASAYIAAGHGNEYIYGGGAIIDADHRGNYFWGMRYFTIVFIRPIPRQLWPEKYADAAAMFGIPNLEDENTGTGGERFWETLGWPGATGAAPGIVADLWLELWWFSFALLFLLGWIYGRAWRNTVWFGGFWIIIYAMLMALSIFLISQTLEAWLFRLLFMLLPSWLAWRLFCSHLAKGGVSSTSRGMTEHGHTLRFHTPGAGTVHRRPSRMWYRHARLRHHSSRGCG